MVSPRLFDEAQRRTAPLFPPPERGSQSTPMLDALAEAIGGPGTHIVDEPLFTEFVNAGAEAFAQVQTAQPQPITPEIEAGVAAAQLQQVETDLAAAEDAETIRLLGELESRGVTPIDRSVEGLRARVAASTPEFLESQRQASLFEPIIRPGEEAFADILRLTGTGPRTFREALAEEMGRGPTGEPFQTAGRRALQRTRGDFPQIGIEAVGPLAGFRDPRAPLDPVFHAGTAEIGPAVVDPLNVPFAAAPVARTTLAAARALPGAARTVAREAPGAVRAAGRAIEGPVARQRGAVPLPDGGGKIFRATQERGEAIGDIAELIVKGDKAGLAESLALDSVTEADLVTARRVLQETMRRSLESLPDEITVFRGGDIPAGAEFVPVSLNRSGAAGFAERAGQSIQEFRVRKTDIAADVDGLLSEFPPDPGFTGFGGERELLVPPSALRRVQRGAVGVPGGGDPSDIRRVEPAFLDPRDATLGEVNEALTRVQRSEFDQLVEAFGSEDEARRFIRLDRRANSTTSPRAADRAQVELNKMTDGLTPEQEQLVYGSIDDPELSEEMLRELLRGVEIGGFDDPQLLISAITRRLSRLTPERVQRVLGASRQEAVRDHFTDAVDVATVREAVGGLRQQGLNDDQIFGGVISKLRSEGVDPADIDVLVGPFARGIEPPPPALPAGRAAAREALEAEARGGVPQRGAVGVPGGGAPFERTVFHGTRAGEVSSFLDDQGNLVIRSSSNFGGKTTGVSFSASRETAEDYATRVIGGGGRRSQQGFVFEVDQDAIPNQLFEEAADEIATRGAEDVVIPAGRFRAVPVSEEAQRGLARFTTEGEQAVRAISDEELGEQIFRAEIRSETDEFLAAGEGDTFFMPGRRLLPEQEDIAARFGPQAVDQPLEPFIEAEVRRRVAADLGAIQRIGAGFERLSPREQAFPTFGRDPADTIRAMTGVQPRDPELARLMAFAARHAEGTTPSPSFGPEIEFDRAIRMTTAPGPELPVGQRPVRAPAAPVARAIEGPVARQRGAVGVPGGGFASDAIQRQIDDVEDILVRRFSEEELLKAEIPAMGPSRIPADDPDLVRLNRLFEQRDSLIAQEREVGLSDVLSSLSEVSRVGPAPLRAIRDVLSDLEGSAFLRQATGSQAAQSQGELADRIFRGLVDKVSRGRNPLVPDVLVGSNRSEAIGLFQRGAIGQSPEPLVRQADAIAADILRPSRAQPPALPAGQRALPPAAPDAAREALEAEARGGVPSRVPDTLEARVATGRATGADMTAARRLQREQAAAAAPPPAGRPPAGGVPEDVQIPPLPGGLPDLTDFGEQLNITFREGRFGFRIPGTGKQVTLPGVTPRRVGEFLRLHRIPVLKDLSLGAQRTGERIGFILNPLVDEGRNLADRAFTYVDELGTREQLFGRLDEQGRFEGGNLAGLTLNDAEAPDILRRLNPEQRAYVDRLRQLDQAATDLRVRGGGEIGELTETEELLFFGRGIAAKRSPSGDVLAVRQTAGMRPRGQAIGGRIGAEQARTVETVESLRAQGFALIPFDEQVQMKLRAAYRANAEDALVRFVKENFETVPATSRFEDSTKLPFQNHNILVRGREGQIIAEDLKVALNRLSPDASPLLPVARLNAVSRYFALAGDASIFTIQLIIDAFAHKKAYAKALRTFTAQLARGIINPEWAIRVKAARTQRSLALANRHSTLKLGGGEFTETFNPEGVLGATDLWDEALSVRGALQRAKAIPRRILEPFRIATESAFDEAGLSMAEGLEQLARNADGTFGRAALQDVDDYINNVRGLMSSARIGVNSASRTNESAVLLASQYRRATGAFYASILQGGIKGDLARKAMFKFITGMMMLGAGIEILMGIEQGKTPQQIAQGVQERMNPSNPRFMLWQIAGQVSGPGSKMISDMRLLAKMATDPGGFVETAEFASNNAVQWIRAQLAFVPGIVPTSFLNRDPGGNPVGEGGALDFTTDVLTGNFVPLFSQAAFFEGAANDTVKGKLIRGGADFVGFRAFPAGAFDHLDQGAEQVYPGKRYRDIETYQKDRVRTIQADLLRPITERRAQGGDMLSRYYLEKDRIYAERDEGIQNIVDALRGAGPVAEALGRRMTKREAVNAYYEQTGGARNQKQGLAAGLQIDFDEQRDGERDRNRQALEAYNETFGAATVGNVFLSEVWDRLVEELFNKLPSPARVYVQRNTNLHPPPVEILVLLSDKARARIRRSIEQRTAHSGSPDPLRQLPDRGERPPARPRRSRFERPSAGPEIDLQRQLSGQLSEAAIR